MATVAATPLPRQLPQRRRGTSSSHTGRRMGRSAKRGSPSAPRLLALLRRRQRLRLSRDPAPAPAPAQTARSGPVKVETPASATAKPAPAPANATAAPAAAPVSRPRSSDRPIHISNGLGCSTERHPGLESPRCSGCYGSSRPSHCFSCPPSPTPATATTSAPAVAPPRRYTGCYSCSRCRRCSSECPRRHHQRNQRRWHQYFSPWPLP